MPEYKYKSDLYERLAHKLGPLWTMTLGLLMEKPVWSRCWRVLVGVICMLDVYIMSCGMASLICAGLW